ncbi:MAG TPA: type II toxin-antitoxin system PemK/MazF family toxin [Methanoregula sp.]|nr:type II toxin-antitoxin system PemK/MazF family toxin [Methanoregula sp.]
MKAKIVLIHFPFTDLTNSKLRPALVLHESEHDVVVAFISSKVPVYLQDSDFLVSMDHPSFLSTGLKVSSVIKFDKIATIAKDLIEGEIGEISRDLADECNLILRRIFIL